ncbi:hypothetical protein ARMSODRAFT_893809 [Armillaria solidipes]|uniref:Integrase core domain-containing protein n=1 Tax=Armillaria solidipes TaxID=1076256 RepID=A0A2H3B9T0_9AGAR|nr:hypothetical protein ARMSODRAFT_893809 [Armillaria solidipes]
MENYRGVIRTSYIWGRSVHNTWVERMWVDTSIGFSNKWKAFFLSLEHDHVLNHHLNQHIWLIHHLFLAHIDQDAQTWAEHWNNHKIALQCRRATPLQMWMEGQLLLGARGLEHLAPDDPQHTVPFASVPNMGLNDVMLHQLQTRQHVQIVALDSGW